MIDQYWIFCFQLFFLDFGCLLWLFQRILSNYVEPVNIWILSYGNFATNLLWMLFWDFFSWTKPAPFTLIEYETIASSDIPLYACLAIRQVKNVDVYFWIIALKIWVFREVFDLVIFLNCVVGLTSIYPSTINTNAHNFSRKFGWHFD
mgnify:CR=1 FL=1